MRISGPASLVGLAVTGRGGAGRGVAGTGWAWRTRGGRDGHGAGRGGRGVIVCPWVSSTHQVGPLAVNFPIFSMLYAVIELLACLVSNITIRGRCCCVIVLSQFVQSHHKTTQPPPPPLRSQRQINRALIAN